jgi:hypothetical protein
MLLLSNFHLWRTLVHSRDGRTEAITGNKQQKYFVPDRCNIFVSVPKLFSSLMLLSWKFPLCRPCPPHREEMFQLLPSVFIPVTFVKRTSVSPPPRLPQSVLSNADTTRQFCCTLLSQVFIRMGKLCQSVCFVYGTTRRILIKFGAWVGTYRLHITPTFQAT